MYIYMFLYASARSGFIPYMLHIFSFLPYGKCFSSAYIYPHPEEEYFYSRFFIFFCFFFPLIYSRGRGENLTFFKENIRFFILFYAQKESNFTVKNRIFSCGFSNVFLKTDCFSLSLRYNVCISSVQEAFCRTLPPV